MRELANTATTNPPPARLTVGIVEDHALFRDGLRLVLKNAERIDVVGDAEDAEGALALIERHHPDVVLLDLSLGDSDGIPLLHVIRDRFPTTRVLVVSMHRHRETVRQALMAGAAGYLVKGARATELVEAIRAVARGERPIHSSVSAGLIDNSIRWHQSGHGVTIREAEILACLARGEHAPDIARDLGISEHTVRRHVANLVDKLGVRGIPGLRSYAVQHGYLRE